MNADALGALLRTFRRQVVMGQILRIGCVVLFMAVLFWALQLPEQESRWVMLVVVLGSLVVFVGIVISAARIAREVQTGTVLLTVGQLDDAEVWLRRAMERFSMSIQAKLLACQQLASLLFKRDAYREVVTVCRELLRHRPARSQRIGFNTRLLLADSLLMLDRVQEAYEAMRPVYETPLTLWERMKLLPIQLRYELAADHSSSAVTELEDKTRIAELLDSSRAALVHALLAEACHRESMTAQRDFLAERAWLYHDLHDLVNRYQVIAPVVERQRAAAPPAPSTGAADGSVPASDESPRPEHPSPSDDRSSPDGRAG